MPFPHYYPPRADTADHTLVSFAAPVPARSRQRPEWQIRSDSAVQEDLDDDSEMWKMFMDEVKEEDNRITDAWKEDANSIVTFTGLFSAIVGAFIIEFYKNLSSASGDQTVALLQQISRQLPNSPK
ncbi:hypothetical protein BGY98DRAFT_1190329 [Russula aff. rugulosa BPL654]|nr:hypothetical protein BGY98DRAFT_1190329 [Russula aff. rugulosa BPL654]